MNNITIVIADDHAVVRQGLRSLFAGEPGFEVIAEAPDGNEAIRLVEEIEPDVLVLDLAMAGLGGLEVVRRLHRTEAKTRIVVLSMYTDTAYAIEAYGCGAMSYVTKNADATELVHAVREAAAGRKYFTSHLADRAVEALVAEQRSRPTDPLDSLSPRERETLCLAAQGQTNPQIGEALFISPRTAELHRANAMKKLGLKTQVELVRYALRRGILPTDV